MRLRTVRAGRFVLFALAAVAAVAWSIVVVQPSAAAEAPANWGVVPDPSTARPAKPPAAVNIALPISWGGEVAAVGRYSTNLAIKNQDRQGDVYEIVDLAAGRKAGRVLVGKTKEAALSADGAFLAVQAADRNAKAQVEVYNAKTGKPVNAFNVVPQGKDPKFVGFAGPANEFLVLTLQEGFATQVMVFDVKAGKKTYEYEENEWLKAAPVISPGGKYLATFNKSNITFHDVAAGKLVGELERPLRTDKPDERGIAAPKGMGFSPDGTMFAGNFEGFFKTVIVVWDLATGAELQKHYVDPIDAGPWGQQFAWLADGSGFLIGRNVVDRATASVVHKLEEAGGRDDQATVSVGNLVVSVGKAWAGRLTIRSAALPKEMMARAAETVKAGGRAEDAGLPPLTAADWSKAVEFKPGEEPLPAKLPADAPPKFAKKFASNALTFRKPAPPPGTDASNNTRGLLFAARNAGIAVAIHDQQDRNKWMAREYRKVWFDRVDLSTMALLNSVELPPVAEVLDLSPDGTHALVRLGDGRVDLWNAEKAGKQVAGFRPFDKEDKNNQKVVWGALIDNSNCLVLNPQGKLAMFSLPKAEAQWVAKVAWQSVPGLSPGRKTGAVATDRGLWLFDTMTGEHRGLFTGGPSWQARFAFNNDGTRVGGAGIVSGNGSLAVWDTATGSLTAQVVLPKGSNAFGVNFLGTAYCLVGGTTLVDLDKGIPLWTYTVGQPAMTPGRPPRIRHHDSYVHAVQQPADDLYWYVTADDDKLAVAALPHEEARTIIAKSKMEDLFAGMPGTKVSVEINVGHTDENRRKAAEQAIVKRLQANGFVVVPDPQPLKVVATVTQAAGREIEYRMMGLGGGIEKVQTTDFDAQLAFMLDGQVCWEAREKSNNGQFMVHVKQGQTAAEVINARNAEMGMGLFMNSPLPKFVPKPKEKPTFGESRLTARGVEK